MDPISQAFVEAITGFAQKQELDSVGFHKGESKDDVMKGYAPRAVKIASRPCSTFHRDEDRPDVPHELSYRFYLRPALDPGNYDWPLQLAVRAR